MAAFVDSGLSNCKLGKLPLCLSNPIICSSVVPNFTCLEGASSELHQCPGYCIRLWIQTSVQFSTRVASL